MAMGVLGKPFIALFPLLFSAGGSRLRRSLSDLKVVPGMPVGDLSKGMAQTLTHERSHCVLWTVDLVYNWTKCAALAADPPEGANPLDNAETMSAIVFFLYYLVKKPEWDFSSGHAVRRERIPAWIMTFRKDT